MSPVGINKRTNIHNFFKNSFKLDRRAINEGMKFILEII